ncbi:MAG: hypothetical protein J5680_05920 [Neisseriaceae bacterium]|nr:hypothetical protein [Neisseriaceae bacterium]
MFCLAAKWTFLDNASRFLSGSLKKDTVIASLAERQGVRNLPTTKNAPVHKMAYRKNLSGSLKQ